MALYSKLVSCFLSIRRFLVLAWRVGILRKTVKWLLRRLTAYWTALSYSSALPLPPSKKCSGTSSEEANRKLDGKQRKVEEVFDPNFEYTPIHDGGTVSLHDAMPSLYPLSGYGSHSSSDSLWSSSPRLGVSRSSLSVYSYHRTRSQPPSSRTATVIPRPIEPDLDTALPSNIRSLDSEPIQDSESIPEPRSVHGYDAKPRSIRDSSLPDALSRTPPRPAPTTEDDQASSHSQRGRSSRLSNRSIGGKHGPPNPKAPRDRSSSRGRTSQITRGHLTHSPERYQSESPQPLHSGTPASSIRERRNRKRNSSRSLGRRSPPISPNSEHQSLNQEQVIAALDNMTHITRNPVVPTRRPSGVYPLYSPGSPSRVEVGGMISRGSLHSRRSSYRRQTSLSPRPHSFAFASSDSMHSIARPDSPQSSSGISLNVIGPGLVLSDPLPRPGNKRSLGNPRFLPTMPEDILRYSNRPTISKAKHPEILIHPLMTKFTSTDPPAGWEKRVHPEGACYFYNAQKRIYAEADLYDSSVYLQTMEDIATLEEFILSNGIGPVLGPNTDLVICPVLHPGDDRIITSYYFVHHDSRSIVFVDTYHANDLSASHELPSGATSEDHLRYEIESQYWYHCQSYPHSSKLTLEKVYELRDSVLHFIGDATTSPRHSTAVYSVEELKNILIYAEEMEKTIDRQSVGAHSCFARFMFVFSRAKFLNFHGEPHARVDRTFSVYGDDVGYRGWFVRCLSPLLFYAPEDHFANLRLMGVDGFMFHFDVSALINKTTDEWSQIVLFGTVMLNANVAFLAIQSVDNNENSLRSPAQIASYVSVLASIGSIVIGLLLSRQQRSKNTRDFAQHVSRLDLEMLAAIYSLPYALLMWGTISFILAISILIFRHSDTVTRTVVGVPCFFGVLSTCWCVWNWENIPGKNQDSDDRLSISSSKNILPKTGGLMQRSTPNFLSTKLFRRRPRFRPKENILA